MGITDFLGAYKPYLYGFVAVGLVVVGAYGRGVIADRDIAELNKNVAVLEQQREEVALSYTNSMQDIANQTERQNNENTTKHRDEIAYYRDRVSKLGGLHDHTATTSSSTSSSTGGNTTTSSRTTLSAEASGFLLQLTNEADQVVDQYLTCQEYVKKITKQSKEK